MRLKINKKEVVASMSLIVPPLSTVNNDHRLCLSNILPLNANNAVQMKDLERTVPSRHLPAQSY